jgi:hypothetical protein
MVNIDVVQRLADIASHVLNDHGYVGVRNGEDVCQCGWRCDSPSHWEHQAWAVSERLVEELALSEEQRLNEMSSGGQTTDYKTSITTSHSDYRYDKRLVTPWRTVPRT